MRFVSVSVRLLTSLVLVKAILNKYGTLICRKFIILLNSVCQEILCVFFIQNITKVLSVVFVF